MVGAIKANRNVEGGERAGKPLFYVGRRWWMLLVAHIFWMWEEGVEVVGGLAGVRVRVWTLAIVY